MLGLSIPSFRKVKDEQEYTVYEIHITLPNGREVITERRYSEFYDFHKQVGKLLEQDHRHHVHFPSKKMPKPLNTNPRFLESRREALEQYLRNLVSFIEISEVHDLLTQFLETSLPHHAHNNLDSSRASSMDELHRYEDEGPRLSHQPLMCFTKDIFIDNYDANPLPNVVLKGILEGLYG